MPNVFGPELLFVGDIVYPFAIRVIIGVSLLHIAFTISRRVPVMKSRLIALLHGSVGVLIILGAFIQPVGLLATGLLGFRALRFSHEDPYPESRGFYILLAALSFLLFLVGAGSIAAFDIPL